MDYLRWNRNLRCKLLRYCRWTAERTLCRRVGKIPRLCRTLAVIAVKKPRRLSRVTTGSLAKNLIGLLTRCSNGPLRLMVHGKCRTNGLVEWKWRWTTADPRCTKTTPTSIPVVPNTHPSSASPEKNEIIPSPGSESNMSNTEEVTKVDDTSPLIPLIN